MANSVGTDARPRPTGARRLESSAWPEHHAPARAGEIGPVRREIIFEPVHEPVRREPAPVEPPPAAPETQPPEPVPARP